MVVVHVIHFVMRKKWQRHDLRCEGDGWSEQEKEEHWGGEWSLQIVQTLFSSFLVFNALFLFSFFWMPFFFFLMLFFSSLFLNALFFSFLECSFPRNKSRLQRIPLHSYQGMSVNYWHNFCTKLWGWIKNKINIRSKTSEPFNIYSKEAEFSQYARMGSYGNFD